MFSDIGSFWVYLSASPLLGLTLTLSRTRSLFAAIIRRWPTRWRSPSS
jgi:hypothetical protein